ncbi:hypothetical protein U1Q18_010016, partial [Sarracenia purpurea var. burkii]
MEVLQVSKEKGLEMVELVSQGKDLKVEVGVVEVGFKVEEGGQGRDGEAYFGARDAGINRVTCIDELEEEL